MSYWACFQCDLLFEVDTGQSTACPTCSQALVPHRPEKIFDLDDATDGALFAEESDDDVTRILPVSNAPVSKKPERTAVLERTTILPLKDASRPLKGRREQQESSREQSRSDVEVWTSAEHARDEAIEISPSVHRSSKLAHGPDPTPRQRTRRGPREESARPAASVDRRTLDHAQPRPLDVEEKLEVTAKTPVSSVQRTSDVFDKESHQSGPDVVADLVDHHLDESLELAGPQKTGGRSKTSAPWGTGITIAVLVGLIAAAILTRPGENQPSQERPVETTTALLTPIFEGLGIKLIPASGSELFEGETWLALGQESARAASGPIPGLTSLRGLTRAIVQDDAGTYIKAITKAFQNRPVRSTFGLVIDPQGTAADLALVVGSLERAGVRDFGLLVERRVDERVGLVDFKMGSGTIPAVGHALIQVGGLGVRADIVQRDGAVVQPAGELLSDLDGGRLNLAALDRRLEELSRRHPLVRVATVYLETGLDIRSIVSLVERARQGPEKERFTRIRLVVR
jgi:hypothetical protein